jgi:dolichol-phosphate mannosyltransferase
MAIFSLQPRSVSQALRAPLAVVVPIYNEAETVGAVINEWSQVFDANKIDYQMILINDGSKDKTLEVLSDLESKDADHLVIVDKPNSGHGRTCRLGYDAAVGSPCVKWVLQIDSDGQCDPVYFPEFWTARMQADCVFGKRVQRDDGFARSATSKICKLGVTFLGGRDISDPNVPYRLIKCNLLGEALDRIPASFNIHNVALTYVLKKISGIRWSYIPIRFRSRQGGCNSINLINVAHWGIDMLLELRRIR